MSVEIRVRDERSITIPAVAPDATATQQIAVFFQTAAREGYKIKSVAAIEVDKGDQRDPYIVTEGVTIILEKDPSHRPPSLVRKESPDPLRYQRD